MFVTSQQRVLGGESMSGGEMGNMLLCIRVTLTLIRADNVRVVLFKKSSLFYLLLKCLLTLEEDLIGS
jgi:hypothetical protein